MHYEIYSPLTKIYKNSKQSEREIATSSKLSRSTVRKIGDADKNITFKTLCQLAEYIKLKVTILLTPGDVETEFSTVATAYKVQRDGFNSWKIHYMDMVDQYRKNMNVLSVLLEPPGDLDFRLKALMASIVRQVSEELLINVPAWAAKRYWLDVPWFPAEMESLKAMATLESPLAFRNNNIFVLGNFLDRK